MNQLPKLRTKYGVNIGIELFIEFPSLDGNEQTFFDADEAAAQTTLSAGGTNFSANDYVVLGTPKQEKTEIVKLSAAAATTLTSGATVFAHQRGDGIQFIPYNQIVVERSTDAGVNFTPLTAVDIRPDAPETYLQRVTDASTDVYRFRFYNSTSTNYSAYSDQYTASGLADNTVGAIKRRALTQLGEKIDGLITDQFLNESLWEARRKVDNASTSWNFRTNFGADIGDIIPGTYSLAVPTDLRDPNTNANILGLRVGRQKFPLEYQDRNRFNENYINVAHTTLASGITGASTSLVLTSSGDFDESGSVYIAAATTQQTVDSVAYTTNTETTATLGTVTGIADSKNALTDVWQGVTFGLPTAYTIDAGKIKFNIPFADTYAGENVEMDYYIDLPVYNSDADVLDEPDYDFYVAYLKWKIKYLKSNGTATKTNDSDYIEWKEGVQAFINQNITGQVIHLIPS